MTWAHWTLLCVGLAAGGWLDRWLLKLARCLKMREQNIQMRMALQEIASLATPEDPSDDERQFARMREIAINALPQSGEQT